MNLGTTATGRMHRIVLAIPLAALILAGGWLDATADHAAATFPGLNGKIAFISNRVTPGNPEGDREIYTMNPDGTNLKQLTKNAADDEDAAWSPDGKKIAFASRLVTPGNPTADREIFVMNADGSGVTQLTFNEAFDDEPAWSPDATRIAFTSDRDLNREVYTMKADGSGQTNRT